MADIAVHFQVDMSQRFKIVALEKTRFYLACLLSYLLSVSEA